MAVYGIFSQLQRNYLRVLFPFTLTLLIFSLGYMYLVYQPLPSGPDLCEVWKERLEIARTNQINLTRQWWEWACLLEKHFDKGKEYLCDDERMMGNYHICFDEPYTPKKPCLVYSFGIDNDFRFDDAIAQAGCEVFSFDPSMGIESHRRSERVQFLNVGLSTSDSDDFMPLMDGYTVNSKKKWKIRTMSSIKKMLGHQNRPIDVLKLDIETYEWAVMHQLVKEGHMKSVKQLTLEWHIFPNEPMRTEFATMYQTYMNLKDLGFRQFYNSPWDRHHSTYYFKSQADNTLVNTLYFSKGKSK